MIDDDVIDEDLIIFWGEKKRIITGADILGRLLRGIVQQKETTYRKYKKNKSDLVQGAGKINR